jgi:hypothetical protein
MTQGKRKHIPANHPASSSFLLSQFARYENRLSYFDLTCEKGAKPCARAPAGSTSWQTQSPALRFKSSALRFKLPALRFQLPALRFTGVLQATQTINHFRFAKKGEKSWRK